MVLQDASSSSPPDLAYVDSSPPEDDQWPPPGRNKPWQDGKEYDRILDSPLVPINARGPDRVFVDLDTLPTAWGRSNRSLQHYREIQVNCSQATDVLHRPLRQEEADGIAHVTAKLRADIVRTTYASMAAVGLSGVQCYRTAGTLRFPGYTPSASFSSRKFLFLRGPPASLVWHSLRLAAYTVSAFLSTAVVFGSVAFNSNRIGALQDPRLSEVKSALDAHARLQLEQRFAKRQVDTTAGPRPGETFEMARQRSNAQDLWKRGQQSHTQNAWEDDMSPTGGAFAQETTADTGSDTGLMTDSQTRDWENRSDYGAIDSKLSASPNRSASNATYKTTQQPNEASPSMSGEPTSKPTGSGSAWERLRQQATSGTSQPSAPTRGPSVTSDSSFGLLQNDQDGQSARAEAQKEFDDRVERERRGQDFDQSSGRRR